MTSIRTIWTLSLILIPLIASANIGPQGFYAHPNKYFVETGSFGGEGIQKALDAGFSEVHSLDIEPAFIRDCKRRFKNRNNVHLWLRDSGFQLWEVIEPINEPITFWLDGHRGTPDPRGGKNTPLMEELEQIKKHPIKTHTIMIDDLHCCNTILFDFLSREDIVNKVLEINPNYTITFEPGGNEGEYPINVLVAFVQ
ncbi:MAG TPA: hypothetical protein VLG49_00395 [Rhabdochlamydiaceae bacterium]|nr:hypothetical protein [Rhabdochlamydiaceae bacterium]